MFAHGVQGTVPRHRQLPCVDIIKGRTQGRHVSTLVVVVLFGSLLACRGDGGTEHAASCRAIGTVADALAMVRATEGNTLESAGAFEAAARAFEQTRAPAELERDWTTAAQALRYYSQTAAAFGVGQADQRMLRSESDVQTWRSAFARVTAFGRGECGMGWSTAFGECRRGAPPAGAQRTRLLFPCAA